MSGIIQDNKKGFPSLPTWLRQKIQPRKTVKMQKFLDARNLKTVCESSLCPNRSECYNKGSLAFLILGNICSRNCKFCAIKKGKPDPVDLSESKKISKAIRDLKVKYAVITSVTRDDLPDKGAFHFARVVKRIKKENPGTKVEVLVPDFKGSYQLIKKVVMSGPDVFNHNVETVLRLYKTIRPGADYYTSLSVIKKAKEVNSKLLTKSGIMLGLGEKHNEVLELMDDLKKAECDILTMGQYLSPGSEYYPVKKFVSKKSFDHYKKIALKKGFRYVASGTWVRSSYYAEKVFN